MGVTIQERPKGSKTWYVVIHHKGKRRSQRIGTKQQALKAKKQAEEKLALGKLGIVEEKPEKVKPFSFYAKSWQEKILPATSKPTTVASYVSVINKHLSPAPFWKEPINDITPGAIEEYLFSKRATLCHSTVAGIQRALSGIFKMAQKHRVVKENPTRGITIPKSTGKQPKDRPDPLNEQQIEQLLNHFRGQHYYEFILFLARVGCRCGEAAALEWNDFDLAKRKVTISRSMSHLGTISDTKTGQARTVDLTPMVVAALKKLKLRSQKNAGFIFHTPSGTPMRMSNFRELVWYPALEELGLPPVRIHDLRHSCASFLITRTKDLYYASKQLGHSSISITCDRYGHLLEDDGPTRLIDVLDEPALAAQDK